MTHDEIRKVVLEELGRIAPDVEIQEIDPTADLREEVDIDSMDFLNLIIALHKRLGVEIPDADQAQLITINGAVDFLSKSLGP
jgi:acyl carrier protein